MNRTILTLIAGCTLSLPIHAATPEAVLTHYADLAHAMYSDSLTTAQALSRRIDALLAEPGERNLAAARDAWVAARLCVAADGRGLEGTAADGPTRRASIRAVCTGSRPAPATA